MLEELGQGRLSDFLGDSVVYRSLMPIDQRLPSLEVLRDPLGLPPSVLPRKVEPAYGRVVGEMLRAACRLESGSDDLSCVILIGDTMHNDGGAFRNICDALACSGGAFICDEDSNPPRIERTAEPERRFLHTANRWQLIDRFENELALAGIDIGPGTAVIVDIDKTALGARGRNHRPIDAARVAAVTQTAREVLGEEIDAEVLMGTYHRFNQPEFHFFTSDNQDFLAYMALVAGGGLWSPDVLEREVITREISSFEDLLAHVSGAEDRLSPGLRYVHRSVVEAVAAGDPTPFKEFRRAEFRETIDRMAPSGDAPLVAELIEDKITITDEVRTKALEWRDRGALILGLSDKPDEASGPTEKLETSGIQPLHRTLAHVVGEIKAPSG